MRFIKLEECTSTQHVARELAESGAEDLTVVCAQRQTKGQGRKGNDWESSIGGLWMTIILRRQLDAQLVPYIALATGIAVHGVLGKLGIIAQIKYPNDLMANLDGQLKKVCGILCQSCIVGDKPKYVLVGIGLNVNNDPPEIAFSLKQLSQRNIDLDQIMIIITNAVSVGAFNLAKEGKEQLLSRLSELKCLGYPP